MPGGGVPSGGGRGWGAARGPVGAGSGDRGKRGVGWAGHQVPLAGWPGSSRRRTWLLLTSSFLMDGFKIPLLGEAETAAQLTLGWVTGR